MEELIKKINGAIAHVLHELNSIRGGRAVPAILEDIIVEYYGTKMPLKQLATVSSPEPKTLQVSPWDKQSITSISKALEQADLGAMPTIAGETIHITLPPLTSERKLKLIKLMGQIVENGRIGVRRAREEFMEELKSKKEASEISEDAFFKDKEKAETEIKKANEKLEEMKEAKEKELETL